MTPTRNERNDNRLLMWVAGSVVAGAATIAVLAGLAAQREAHEAEALSAHSRPVFRPMAAPLEPTREDAVSAGEALLTRYEPAAVVAEPVAAQELGEFAVEPGENFVARALETYGAREFDHAVAYLEAEIADRPQRAWTHYMLGLALWKAGRLDEAEVAMEQSATLAPDSLKTLVNLARIRNDQGDFRGALEVARVGVQTDPQNASAHFLEGRSLLNLGRVADAITSLSASLAIDADNGYVQNLYGLALMRQGQVDEAVTSFVRASTLEPHVGYVQNNLGMALELSGRTAEAVAAYRRGVAVDPTHGKVVANLARLAPTVAGRAGVSPIPALEAEGPLVADNSSAP